MILFLTPVIILVLTLLEPASLEQAPGNHGASENHTAGSPSVAGPGAVTPGKPEPHNQRGGTGTEDDLDQIKNNMLGGVTAIRDSVIGLLAFLIGGAKKVVKDEVKGVIATVENVVNKTIVVKDSVETAGGAIANAFGESFKQTGNITNQLVNSISSNPNLGRRKRNSFVY